jgi:soluble lytic murein transglycosylase-like protein
MVLFCAGRTRARLQERERQTVYADHYGVPRTLVDAIIEQETDWNPLAQSVKDAEGLMHLMPVTAAMYGVRNRYNILENLRGGFR